MRTEAQDRILRNPLRTRDDLAELLRALVDPLVPHLSPGSARIQINRSGAHFDEVAAELEGFARPLWGIVPLLAGGFAFEHIDRWLEGFVNGTDPEHEEYWGEPLDRDQRLVEMAAFGFALAMCGDVFWDTLSSVQKERLNSWLLNINTVELPENNWRFFKIVVNTGLRIVGGKYSQKAIDEEFEWIESFWQDGWPYDGPRGSTLSADYYASSFAIPFYSLLYSKWAQSWDPDRCELFRARARNMALDVVHLFGPDGASIPFGRSMTYRFAMSAFWAAAAYADVELPAPLSWGVVKGLLLRNFRWFTAREVFAADGTMTIGYAYSNQIMAENYNSPQSPYWCLKSLLPLSLPATHPFWTTQEEPYPAGLLAETRVVRPINQVFSHAAGHTFLLSSGQSAQFPLRHAAQKYGKLAYSSAFGFSVPTGSLGIEQQGADSTLALCDDAAGQHWRVRREGINVTISDSGIIKSDWVPWPDVSVTTWLIPPTPGSGFHVRVHHIKTSRALISADSSFSNYNRQGVTAFRRAVPLVANLVESEIPPALKLESAGSSLLVSECGATGIIDLSAGAPPRLGKVVDSDANANLIFARSAVPMLVRDLNASEESWVVSAVFGVPSVAAEGPDGWHARWMEVPSVPAFVLNGLQAEGASGDLQS